MSRINISRWQSPVYCFEIHYHSVGGASMEDNIGCVAGQVWQFLKDNGEASNSAIIKGTNLPANQVQRAIGWLAREEKICIRKDKRSERISLV